MRFELHFWRLAVFAFAALSALCSEEPVTTHHQATIGGKMLNYTAKAGFIPIRDNDTGEVHGNMFYISYTLDRPAGSAPRPLTFLWNGGPGSNSGLVHLLGFGPKRIAETKAGKSFVDNQDSWLPLSDLVFVDPIGTGYSRPTKAEYGSEFYQTRGDAESVAEFIRVYRTRVDAFASPLFIMGESYGVTRCALVAAALERRGTSLAGVIMLSGGFPLVDNDATLRAALNLPTLTAAAYYNKKLPPDLQAGDLRHALEPAEAFAKGDYAIALSERDRLSDARREEIVAQLARFTGLPAAQIDRTKLVVPMEQFSVALLADQNLMVGRYDSRIIGPRDPSPQYDPTTDPSLKDILDSVSVIRYLRNELGVKSDLFYAGPFGGGYPPAKSFRGDWMSVRWNRGVAPNAKDDAKEPTPTEAFRKALAADPKLRVMVVTGYYDLVSSYFGIELAATRLPADLSGRVLIRTYAGGHAIYTDDTVRHEFRVEAANFYRAAEGK
ncbi:MAG TPA: hypothetical protein VKU01_24200 [Bryobacteraceae bacterium]|nr:hypothetical protein [Bryobacteraceae bacterium]